MSASAVLRLQKVGFTTDQVEALADFMDTQAASKADLERETHAIRGDVAELKAELKADIADVRAEIAEVKAELKAEIADVKAELKADIAGVRVEIAEVKADLRQEANRLGAAIELVKRDITIKLGGMLVIMTGVLLAAIRYTAVTH